ncbi:hypothetical protein [Paenibacillus sp. GP183]|uniref:hypothetical protein n=1 Tax=Paenibacillus sp. GP183 TaxID=1882751 RepID=UPI000896841B|nr:hypothetical protein [Paenibacillus sp. GP183]SED07017.1 hypothetical protein SAMN05443246_5575 [Paenibacillus sp. GP183]
MDAVINLLIRLEAEWEPIESTYAKHLAEHYSLSHDYRDVVYQMLGWREKL